MFRLLANGLRKAAVVIQPNEIVPGTEKPTIILAKMMALEMLEHLDAPVNYQTTTFPKFTVRWDTRNLSQGYWKGRRNEIWIEPRQEVFVTAARWRGESRDIPLSLEEKDVLSKAYRTFDKLRADYQNHKAEEERQQAAVDAIAKFMGVAEGVRNEEG